MLNKLILFSIFFDNINSYLLQNLAKYTLGINKKIKVNIDKTEKKYIGLFSPRQEKVKIQYMDDK